MEMGFPPDGAEALSLSSAVDCRIGSLEITNFKQGDQYIVDCRIGSLEILFFDRRIIFCVDCRIGSLETVPDKGRHCRIPLTAV